MRSYKILVLGLSFLTMFQSAMAAVENSQFTLKSKNGSTVFSDTNLGHFDQFELKDKLVLTIKSTTGGIRSSEFLLVKGERLPLVNGETLHLGNDVRLDVSKIFDDVTIVFSGVNGPETPFIREILASIKYDVKKGLPKYRYNHYLDERIFTLRAE